MAFILRDRTIGQFSSTPIQQTIVRVSEQLNISCSSAFFLLVQYGWDEKQVLADKDTLLKVAPILRFYSTVDFNQTYHEHCLIGRHDTRCNVLFCKHYVCKPCLAEHMIRELNCGHVVMVCPSPNCGSYVNPDLIRSLPPAVKEAFTVAVVENFIARTYQHPVDRLKKGVAFVWKNRVVLLLTGFVGSLAIGAKVRDLGLKNKKTKKNTGFDIKVVLKEAERRGCVANPKFWWTLLWKNTIGRKDLKQP